MSVPILHIDELEFTRDTRHGDKFEAKLAPDHGGRASVSRGLCPASQLQLGGRQRAESQLR